MLIQANALALPIQSGIVQCVVTSPPYWGLRDYGTATWVGGDAACDHDQRRFPANGKQTTSAGSARDSLAGRTTCRLCGATRIDAQLGLEATPDLYVASMVQVFREVWRVLRDDGTLWLNLGSSYARDAGKGQHKPGDVGKQNYIIERGGGRAASGGIFASPFRRHQNALACGNDGRELQCSTDAGSSCFDLCDGCLADFLSHRDRIAGSGRPHEQCEPLPSQTGRDNEPRDSAASSLASWPLGVPASTTLESWRQHRGACSRCDSRASSLSGLHSSSADARAFAGMSWLDYTTRLKQKDMVPIPWMVAMALQADGWYLRSDIIWAKPNPMPESVTDRPTKAHEYLFLLTKSQRYYYDADAIAEPANPQNYRANASMLEVAPGSTRQGKLDARRGEVLCENRNRRSVWTVNTQPYADAHFATFPEKLVEPCILAGSKPGDLVLDPFAGSGTVGRVALKHGRRTVGVDLNAAYLTMAERRQSQIQPRLADL